MPRSQDANPEETSTQPERAACHGPLAGPFFDLSYCMNVHPAESLEQLRAAIRGPVRALARSFLSKSQIKIPAQNTFPVGLWLSAESCRELAEPRRLESFRDLLGENGLHAFSANIFPYGGFHAERVKREVYRPTWAAAERLRYSLQAAQVLASLLPSEKNFGSLSTLPLGFKAFSGAEADRAAMLRHLAEMVRGLVKIREETGRELALALEPEPFGSIESTAELIETWESWLLPGLLEELKTDFARGAEPTIRRHLGACFDTCHLAIAFEDLGDSIRQLRAAGIRIAKTQISVALELREPATNREGLARLRHFIEPRYLHQVIGRDSRGGKLRAEDLPEIFSGEELCPAWRGAEALRVHFHLPIFWRGDESLGTTRGSLNDLIPSLLAAGCQHFEVETYTWSVLPKGAAEAKNSRASGESLGDAEAELTAGLIREMMEARSLFPGPQGQKNLTND